MMDMAVFRRWAEEQINALVVECGRLQDRINCLEEGQEQIMGIEADIKSQFETYKSNVDAKMAAQQDAIAALNTKLAALPPTVDIAALQADLDEITAANAALVAPAQ